MKARPTLLPGIRPLWRDRHRVQLGLGGHRSVVLELADPSAGRLLTLLDGSRTEAVLLDEAAHLGIDSAAVRTLLDDLKIHGLLIPLPAPGAEAGALARDHERPAEILRRRRGRRVVVGGGGRVARLVVDGLREAEVGRVAARLPGRLLAGDHPRVRVAAATVAVEVSAGRLPIATPGPLLVVVVHDGIVTIGPVVLPGQGPCLECLRLWRIDRDPAWPRIEAQLPADASGEPCAVTTAHAAAARVISEVLALVDGEAPVLLGGSVDVAGPHEIAVRRWERHRACHCDP